MKSSQINDTQTDNTKDIDIVMPKYNLIQYCPKYSETLGRLWQYCKNILVVNDNGQIVGANATDSFNLKANTTRQTGNN